MSALFYNFVVLFVESAPWLVFGLLIAGMMKWVVPFELLNRHMGSQSLTAISKAAFIGAPLPLCSCGVIPAALGLRRAGASKPATISFLVSTPETGVDSVSVSYALLGPFMAIIRPIAAIVSAIYTGILVKFFISDVDDSKQSDSEKTTRCCAKNENQKTPVALSFSEKIIESIKFASGKLLNDITRWLLLGLILAAAIKTWVATDFLTQWGDGFVAMIVMALIGIPMYICATASTPLAAGFLAVGVSPGAVLVFLLAGPATNLSTMGMIRQEMGNSVLVAYLIGILSASIGIGYLANWLVAEFNFEIYKVAASHHEMDNAVVYMFCAGLLALLMIKNQTQLFLNKSKNKAR